MGLGPVGAMTPEPCHVVATSDDFSTTVNVPCLELALEFCEFLAELGWAGVVESGHYRGPLTPSAESTATALTRAFANRLGAC